VRLNTIFYNLVVAYFLGHPSIKVENSGIDMTWKWLEVTFWCYLILRNLR